MDTLIVLFFLGCLDFYGNEMESNQIKSNQIKSNQIKCIDTLFYWMCLFLGKHSASVWFYGKEMEMFENGQLGLTWECLKNGQCKCLKMARKMLENGQENAWKMASANAWKWPGKCLKMARKMLENGQENAWKNGQCKYLWNCDDITDAWIETVRVMWTQLGRWGL